jgi:hypothetical protein
VAATLQDTVGFAQEAPKAKPAEKVKSAQKVSAAKKEQIAKALSGELTMGLVIERARETAKLYAEWQRPRSRPGPQGIRPAVAFTPRTASLASPRAAPAGARNRV